ncbi:unnamed protein product [Leptosia nina]|uniref:PHD-type domain-containing protein n=1 Tax=Leptosia nina TaxID=320188 RepID=A0AAV1JNB8_9NEOP
MLTCKTCERMYHHQCLSISSTHFNTYKSELERLWTCPVCRGNTDEATASQIPSEVNVSGQDNSEMSTSNLQTCPEQEFFTPVSLQVEMREMIKNIIVQETQKAMNNLLENVMKVLNNKLNSFSERLKTFECNLNKLDINKSSSGLDKTIEHSLQLPGNLTAKSKRKQQRKKFTPTTTADNIAPPAEPQSQVSFSQLQDSALTSQVGSAFKQVACIGDWTEVKRKKPRQASRIVQGTAQCNISGLEASEKISYFHLFYVKKGTSAEQISNHLQNIGGIENFN